MRLYFDRHGKYRGYGIGPLGIIAAALIIGALALAFGYQLVLLAPFIGLWALVVWAYRSEYRRWRARHPKPEAGQPSDAEASRV